jgi:hypothetical protein
MELVRVMKSLLYENLNPVFSVGCNNFPKNTEDFKWCLAAEQFMKSKPKLAKDAVDKYKKEYLSQYGSGIRAVKYDKEMDFFKERRNDVIKAMEIFKVHCPKLYNYIYRRMVEFSNGYVILDENNNYHPLNRLNTNYSALAYIATFFIPQIKKTIDIEQVLKDYFTEIDNSRGTTEFESSLDKLIFENPENSRDKTTYTLEKTWGSGQDVEDEFDRFLKDEKNNLEVYHYSGLYSFMDMIGIDMMIKSPTQIWVPVQVKKSQNDCVKSANDRSYKLQYRENMCENWCVSSENNNWVINTFNGSENFGTFLQPKNKPLDLNFFLSNRV